MILAYNWTVHHFLNHEFLLCFFSLVLGESVYLIHADYLFSWHYFFFKNLFLNFWETMVESPYPTVKHKSYLPDPCSTLHLSVLFPSTVVLPIGSMVDRPFSRSMIVLFVLFITASVVLFCLLELAFSDSSLLPYFSNSFLLYFITKWNKTSSKEPPKSQST